MVMETAYAAAAEGPSTILATFCLILAWPSGPSAAEQHVGRRRSVKASCPRLSSETAGREDERRTADGMAHRHTVRAEAEEEKQARKRAGRNVRPEFRGQAMEGKKGET